MTDVDHADQADHADIRVEPNGKDGPNTKVTIVVDGTVVSWTWIVPMTIRVGRATVRMDGIGGVETLESHRNRGYSRRVLTAAVEHIKAGNAPLSTLYGIAGYYPRWRYATVGAERRNRLDRLDVDNILPEAYADRAAVSADLARIRSLYADATRDAVGAVVREEAGVAWQRLATSIDAGEDECRVIVDAAGAVVAYAWRGSGAWWIENREKERPEAFHVGEAFASSSGSADALLAATRRWATDVGRSGIELHLPLIGPLDMAARLQDGVTCATSSRDAEFMGRSTGVVALMRSLLPELNSRWSGTDAGWTGELEVRTGEDSVVLRLGASSVDVGATPMPVDPASGAPASRVVAELSPGNVARLAFGSFPPRELLARAGVFGDAADALSCLFPERTPHIHAADRF